MKKSSMQKSYMKMPIKIILKSKKCLTVAGNPFIMGYEQRDLHIIMLIILRCPTGPGFFL